MKYAKILHNILMNTMLMVLMNVIRGYKIKKGGRDVMKIRYKLILSIIFPIVLLGIIIMWIILSPVNNMVQDEIMNSLKGTANATLAAYEQNSGAYEVSKNGELWKGVYNISKSDALVDGIKKKTGMEVTFFYGDKRIMTSAKDKNGRRILDSAVGSEVFSQVIKGKKDYFTSKVLINNVEHYGYFIPVYNNEGSEPIGMIFAGTNKDAKDAITNKLFRNITFVVLAVIIVCTLLGLYLSSSLVIPIKRGIETVSAVSSGNLETEINDIELKRSDEVGDMTRAIKNVRDVIRNIMNNLGKNINKISSSSKMLNGIAMEVSDSINNVKDNISMQVEAAAVQEENALTTTENMNKMGLIITESVSQTEKLNILIKGMENSGRKSEEIMRNLLGINKEVNKSIQAIENQFGRIENAVENIAGSSALINSIAKQTELLSLNASLEAARAGIHGRGFAVVADEVKQLAAQSAETSEDIGAVIKNLILETQNSSKTMKEVCNIIGEQDKSLIETGEIFSKVINDVNCSAKEISEISKKNIVLEETRSHTFDLINELNSLSAENTASIREIYDLAMLVSGKFEEVFDSAKVLDNIAGDVTENISFFFKNGGGEK